MKIINDSKVAIEGIDFGDHLIGFGPKEVKEIPDENAEQVLNANDSLKEFKEVEKKLKAKKKK